MSDTDLEGLMGLERRCESIDRVSESLVVVPRLEKGSGVAGSSELDMDR